MHAFLGECPLMEWVSTLTGTALDREEDTFTRLCLAGAALDTGNLGVYALGLSVVQGVYRSCSDASITVFDHGRGLRHHALGSNGAVRPVEFCGAMLTRRLYRPEAFGRIRLAARLGGLWNPAAKRILAAGAMLDISGGDSFTDLYGLRRFHQICLPKWIALENRVPLILLPQTYGPFRAGRTREQAARIVRGSAMAWARDARSFDALRDLLEDGFNPERHRLGVDVAFGLEVRDPGDRLPGALREWLESAPASRPLGINISGLIYHDLAKARDDYGFVADYQRLIERLIAGLSERTDRPILLIPHVLTPAGHYESDPEACCRTREALPAKLQGRVHLVPPDFDAGEMKWIISRCSWFCGTRMHSTIAGLSSGVPTTVIAYSPKTQGVFESCGLGEAVVDPRELGTDECVERLLDLFHRRHELAATLAVRLPAVKAQAERQMDEIVAFINEARARA